MKLFTFICLALFSFNTYAANKLGVFDRAGNFHIKTKQILHREYNQIIGIDYIEIYGNTENPDVFSVSFGYCYSDLSGCGGTQIETKHYSMSDLKKNIVIRTDARLILHDINVPMDLIIIQDQSWANRGYYLNQRLDMSNVNIDRRLKINGRSRHENIYSFREVRTSDTRNTRVDVRLGIEADHVSIVNSHLHMLRFRLSRGENEVCIQGSAFEGRYRNFYFGNDDDSIRVIDSPNPRGPVAFGYRGIDISERHNAPVQKSSWLDLSIEEYGDCPNPVPN